VSQESKGKEEKT